MGSSNGPVSLSALSSPAAVPNNNDDDDSNNNNNNNSSSSSSSSSTQYHQSAEPPPYSGPTSTSTPRQPSVPFSSSPSSSHHQKPPHKHPGLPLLNYQLYAPPLFELSSDCTTLKSTAPYLSSSASALVNLIRAQASVPPKPQLHITGTRANNSYGKPDFALKLNLMHLLVPDETATITITTTGGKRGQQRMDYIRTVAPGEPALRGGTRPSLEPDLGDHAGLEAWARRFVEDKSPVKAFVLERTVVNLDTSWLEGQVRSLVAATGYKGVVSVTFPVTHARVVVQSPDKVNKFFTGLTTLFSGKSTYEVVKAVWPFASCSKEDERVCVVQSEEQWWREWAQSIRYAIATRRNGWVTVEDKLEAIMEGKGKGISTVDWGDAWQY
ncbi:hypothetical protein M406DRAFT_253163 [Cryphonectria parasitica EP155]|uniref:Uncharacterized protein n=1 Tax=Cryphonectria parasitica (strain ATCC 38755 / EP155) TaxID=660469 RepID=A0A9P5CRE9_CRYP1|nr:uncharacterized protein M406DRAFT_253163 [Cryphonectria parasitica EP155]KAF3767462.1 hypothetical protein M406DRAFT_253163 [Cryphonectria parasitica EP155]